MSEEIKALKKKLKKKNDRIRELNEQLATCEAARIHLSNCCDEVIDDLYEARRYFPQKYYKITFEREDKDNGISVFKEIHTAWFAEQLVRKIKSQCFQFKLIAIEETAS